MFLVGVFCRISLGSIIYEAIDEVLRPFTNLAEGIKVSSSVNLLSEECKILENLLFFSNSLHSALIIST